MTVDLPVIIDSRDNSKNPALLPPHLTFSNLDKEQLQVNYLLCVLSLRQSLKDRGSSIYTYNPSDHCDLCRLVFVHSNVACGSATQ